jgi:hypothetical protein
MAWVQMVAVEIASGKLQEVYQRVRERAGVVPNIAKVQSLRPKTTERGFEERGQGKGPLKEKGHC